MKETPLKKTFIAIAIVLISHSAMEVDSIYAQSNQGGYIETHVHLRVQPRPGGPQVQSNTVVDYDSAANQLLAEMDKHGVEKALILPPPQIPGQRTACDYKDLLGVVQRHPGRLFLVAGGNTLNRLIHQYSPTEVTPEVRAQFEKMAQEIIRAGAKGFGEMAALHLSFNPQHVFEEVAPDHPLFLLLADIAARSELPIDLHTEAVSKDMDLPAGFSKVSSNNPPVLHANIPALERLLVHNKKAKIVWQHIGWDNTGCMTIGLLRRLLTAHPNLYLSLRVERRPYDMVGRPMPNRIVDDRWRVRPEWLEFISDFPERFMIGTDNFFGDALRAPRGRALPQTMKETWSIVDQLPPGLAGKVGRDNAARVYNLKR